MQAEKNEILGLSEIFFQMKDLAVLSDYGWKQLLGLFATDMDPGLKGGHPLARPGSPPGDQSAFSVLAWRSSARFCRFFATPGAGMTGQQVATAKPVTGTD